MQWEEYLVSFGTLVLVLGLVPTVFGRHKPALSTSLVTFAVLSSFVVAFFSLHLYLAAALNTLNALVWGIIALQVFSAKRKNKDY